MEENIKDPIDCLFDEDNNDPIVLLNEKGEEQAFEQIAVIPQSKKTYAILQPIGHMDGVGENEGLVFAIEEFEDGGEYLKLVTDEKIIDEVFDVYEEMWDDAECDCGCHCHDGCDCEDDCDDDCDCHCEDEE